MNTYLFYVQLIFSTDMLESPEHLWERAWSGRRSNDETGTFGMNVASQAAIASRLASTC